MLEDSATYTSFMLSDVCYNWVYMERGLEVVRDEDPEADLATTVATTVECYRALATVGTEFGWFTMEDPDTFHRYDGPPGDLSPVLVAKLEAITTIPSPSTLGFFRNEAEYSVQVVADALARLRRSKRDRLAHTRRPKSSLAVSRR